jgi:hypothetical protein
MRDRLLRAREETLGRGWNEKRETQIAVAISDLGDRSHKVDSEAISKRLGSCQSDLGELSEHDRAQISNVSGISETEVLVLHGLEALKMDGIITAVAREIDQWPHIAGYDCIALTGNGLSWVQMLRRSR